ncbi:tetratricopeptide repeat protein [Nocardia aurantia]|uniref:Tetratricopeptide repeat protein n=1 Tax=Nocardia aurantia TaxID=2585199 RepID=A0A7K0DJN1_9NOCA|nr:tetratricopeptide repeat protein [Nocardia aurantia]MQY26016.1 hypothetical protein [Nocardia aurantia]
MTTRTWSTAGSAVPCTVLASADADHRLRGPYSAGGAILRRLAPDLLARHPDLVARHDIELIAVAPELADRIACARATLMASAAPEERTRYYPAVYTARLAHGITDLLLEYCRELGAPQRLVIRHVELADPTDAELFAVLVRRADPAYLVLDISADGPVPARLAGALARYATECAPSPDIAGHDGLPDLTGLGLSGAAADPAVYNGLGDAERARWHDRWAAELEQRGELSLTLGIVPLLLERGTDPSGAGAVAVERALAHCTMQGFYEATVRFGRRALELLNWRTDPERSWLVTIRMCTALSALNRPAEAEELYDRACANTTLPGVHLQSAYGRAMLYTRFYADRRDHDRARTWINTAIAFASLSTEKQRRAYNLSFQENGKALIEMHTGNPAEALRLIDAGLARMTAEVDSGRFDPHRSVLAYNRAQLLARIGDPREALAAYAIVIAMDPNHSEYYGERAAVHRKLGDTEHALADYAHAIAASPPYPEVHFNRGDLLMELGDHAGALADLDRALELDDGLVDAYVNRASCRLELGDVEAAADDVAAGLSLDPDQAELHCLLGLIEQARGHREEAARAFDRAVRLNPALVAGWANAGVLAHEYGDADAAIGYLDRALELDDDPIVRANRGIAHSGRGDHAAAVADFTAAMAADPDSHAELRYRRGTAHLAADDRPAGVADLTACLAAGDPEFAALARTELDRIGE